MTKFKNAQVIMLPTQEKSNIFKIDNTLCYGLNTVDSSKKSQHLYIVNSGKIEVGDWYLTIRDNYIGNPSKCVKIDSISIISQLKKSDNPNHTEYTEFRSAKKVIATSYKNLVQPKKIINKDKFGNIYNPIFLPQPSDSFIQKYIDSYNAKDVITDVLVEYEFKGQPNFYGEFNLKINDKFNTITIKEIKQYHGNTLDYWKQNAEEDYIKVPISVLKYITILENALTDKL